MSTISTTTSLQLYESQFNEHQQFVKSIAIEMLGSSYNLAKSNGYKIWLSEKEKEVLNKEPVKNSTKEPVIHKVKARKLKVVRTKIKEKTLTEKVLEYLKTEFDKVNFQKEELSYHLLTNFSNEAGFYTLINSKSVLFVGTTSDLKKNVILACKNVIKNIKDEEKNSKTIEQIKHAIGGKDNELKEVFCIWCKEDNNKRRIQLRNCVKLEYVYE